MQRIEPRTADLEPNAEGTPRRHHFGQRLAAVLGCAIVAAAPVPGQAGSLDPTFGSGGKVTTGLTGHVPTFGRGTFAMQSDGKIIAAGFAYAVVTGGDFLLTRYNADGSLDTGFGVGGKVQTDFG